jgi:hypothetical protein
MIQQKVGDLLEVKEGSQFVYVVVLTRIVLFGGNILFAFHTDGERRAPDSLDPTHAGFNICADLLWPKREGRVTRIHRFADVAPFWRTRFVKSTFERRPGVKAREWFIYTVDRMDAHTARLVELPPEYRAAMDSGCCSFDLVASKVLARYSPDQNEHL